MLLSMKIKIKFIKLFKLKGTHALTQIHSPHMGVQAESVSKQTEVGGGICNQWINNA